MRSARWTCALSLVLACGCSCSHGRGDHDAGSHARRDAGFHDAGDATSCTEGVACDDGDPCTLDDRCRAGRCTGAPLTCDGAPGPCFEPTGACVDGVCVHELAEGTLCDDGDACTTADACLDGVCRGSAMACDEPPAPECADRETLRVFASAGSCAAGACTYAPTERACPDGCADGACRCVPTTWAVTVVDGQESSSAGPRNEAVAVDGAGTVHVVYPRRLAGESGPTVRYARRAPDGTWTSEALGPGEDGSILVDGSGVLHLVYVGGSSGEPIYGTRAPGEGWIMSPVPSDVPEEELARGYAMAVSDAGVVGIVRASLLGDIVYIERSTSGAWSTEIGPRVSTSPHAAAFDGAGKLHLVHRAPRELRYAHRFAPGAWSTSAIGAWAGGGVELEHDPADALHMIFTRSFASHYELVHGAKDSPAAAWRFDTIAEPDEPGASLAMDAGGGAHVVYLVDTASFASSLQHAWLDGAGRRTAESVPSPPIAGTLWSALVAVDDTLHLVFRTQGHALVHAQRRICF